MINVQPITTQDREWVQTFLEMQAGSSRVVSRGKLKPEIPHIGNDGIPIRDELEFEIKL